MYSLHASEEMCYLTSDEGVSHELKSHKSLDLYRDLRDTCDVELFKLY